MKLDEGQSVCYVLQKIIMELINLKVAMDISLLMYT